MNKQEKANQCKKILKESISIAVSIFNRLKKKIRPMTIEDSIVLGIYSKIIGKTDAISTLLGEGNSLGANVVVLSLIEETAILKFILEKGKDVKNNRVSAYLYYYYYNMLKKHKWHVIDPHHSPHYTMSLRIVERCNRVLKSDYFQNVRQEIDRIIEHRKKNADPERLHPKNWFELFDGEKNMRDLIRRTKLNLYISNDEFLSLYNIDKIIQTNANTLHPVLDIGAITEDEHELLMALQKTFFLLEDASGTLLTFYERNRDMKKRLLDEMMSVWLSNNMVLF